MQFNHINKIELVCRAHQLVQEGLKYMFDKGLVTVSFRFACRLASKCSSICSLDLFLLFSRCGLRLIIATDVAMLLLY